MSTAREHQEPRRAISKGGGHISTPNRQENRGEQTEPKSHPKKRGGGVPPPPPLINAVVEEIQKFQRFRGCGALPHKTPAGVVAMGRLWTKITRRASEIKGGGDVSHNTPLCDKNPLSSLDEILARMAIIIRNLCRIMGNGGQWSTVMASGGAGSNFSGRWKSARWQSSAASLAHHFSKNGDSAPPAQGATGGGVVHRIADDRWRAELANGWWIGDGSTPGEAIKRVIIAYNREAVRSGTAEIKVRKS